MSKSKKKSSITKSITNFVNLDLMNYCTIYKKNASNELVCKTLYLCNIVYTAKIHLEYEMVQPCGVDTEVLIVFFTSCI